MNQIYKDKEVCRIVSLIEKVYSKSKIHLSSFNNEGFKHLEQILAILILERLVGNLNATRILLSKIEDNPNVETAIGLILRNNLSLCKIVYKHDELLRNKSNLSDFYKSIFGENIQRTIKLILRNHKSEEVYPYIDNIKKQFTFLLNETGINLDNIACKKFDFSLCLPSKFQNLENLFLAYSKYEHFGLNTLILQGSNNRNEILERISIAIHFSLQGILLCLSSLQIIDNELNEINKELAKKNSTNA